MSRFEDTHLTNLHLIDDRKLKLGGTDESQTHDASIEWDNTNSRIKISGNAYFVNDVTLAGTLTFGDVNVDTMILLGRMSTMTAGGSAVDINAAYINTYQELWEIRNTISNWGTKDSYKGFYFRTEADIGVADPTAANCGLRNFEFYAVMDCSTTTGLSSLQNVYAEMLIKAGAGARTLVNGHCIEANISIDNQGANTLTLTNNIYGLYAKIQSGTGINDYTKLNGIRISGRDDGTVRVFGNALDICNPEATVCTWTNAINISTASAVGILLAGATTTGLKITGSATNAISILTGTFSTSAINIAGTTATGIIVGATSVAGITIAATATGISIAGVTTTGISITGNATTGISLATGVFGTGIAVGGTTAIGIAIAGTSSSGLTIATTPAGIWMTGVYSTAGITIQPASGTTPIGIQISGGAGVTTTGMAIGATVTGILFNAASTTGINFTTAPTTTGIGMVGAASYLGLRIGNFHTTAAGSGVIVSNTIRRTCDVLCDDNGVGTVGAAFINSARFRLMGTGASYLGEAYALHGLFKYSPVTTCSTSSYTAGILGAFEWATNLTVAGGCHGGIIGRVGGGAVQVAISANSYVAGLIAGNNMSSAATGDGKTVGFLATAFNTQDWDIGFKVDANTCSTGVSIGTCGTGIDFPSGSTYTVGAVKCGTFDSPIVFTGDELWEIHGRVSAATDSKPLFRIRNSAFAGSMTTGSITTLEVTAYGSLTGSSNLFEVRAINAGAGIKSASTLITGAFMTAGRFKLEDLGFDLTANAGSNLAVLDLRWQFNTGTTLSGTSAWINCYHEGNISLNAQTIIGGLDATGSGIADYFFAIPTGSSSNIPFYATGCSVTAATHPYLKCNIGGVNYGIPMIAL